MCVKNGDKLIQNFHLGRDIIRFTVRNQVFPLRSHVAINLNFRPNLAVSFGSLYLSIFVYSGICDHYQRSVNSNSVEIVDFRMMSSIPCLYSLLKSVIRTVGNRVTGHVIIFNSLYTNGFFLLV